MTPQRNVIELGQLKERLGDMAQTLAAELLPRGRQDGPLWREARRSAGGYGDSLILYTRGPKRGTWRWFATGQFGDLLDLYGLIHNCGLRDSIQWARGRLGFEAQATARPRWQPHAPPPDDEYDRKREELMRRRAAGKRVWLASSPALLDTPVEGYFERRGTPLGPLIAMNRGLRSLRFHPALHHPDANADFPAMVALCLGPTGKIAGIHRTYLVKRADGWDRLREDRDGHKGKLLWCSIHGAVVPLWRGERSDPATGELFTGRRYTDTRAGPELLLCEGIEKALRIIRAMPERRVASVLSLPNWTLARLPPHFSDITWAGDRMPDPEQWVLDAIDKARREGADRREIERAAERARLAAEGIIELDRRGCERLIGEGRAVRVARPPPGFNDWDERGAA